MGITFVPGVMFTRPLFAICNLQSAAHRTDQIDVYDLQQYMIYVLQGRQIPGVNDLHDP